MARGRNSIYVKKLTGRDVTLLKGLARTGIASQSQAGDFCGLNSERLQKLENSKYIKLRNLTVNGQNTQIIQLDKGGKDYCRNELSFESFAAAQTNHLDHDLKLSFTYYSLNPEIRETWEHERDIILEIYEKYPEIQTNNQLRTCIDARITLGDGTTLAIESVGDSYGNIEIMEKEAIAINLAGCDTISYV